MPRGQDQAPPSFPAYDLRTPFRRSSSIRSLAIRVGSYDPGNTVGFGSCRLLSQSVKHAAEPTSAAPPRYQPAMVILAVAARMIAGRKRKHFLAILLSFRRSRPNQPKRTTVRTPVPLPPKTNPEWSDCSSAEQSRSTSYRHFFRPFRSRFPAGGKGLSDLAVLCVAFDLGSDAAASCSRSFALLLLSPVNRSRYLHRPSIVAFLPRRSGVITR